jgi:hypothetical protein
LADTTRLKKAIAIVCDRISKGAKLVPSEGKAEREDRAEGKDELAGQESKLAL